MTTPGIYGIIFLMKINPNNRSLKRIGRKLKLEGHSSRETKAARKAIFDFIAEKRAELSQDRARYGATLLKTWEANLKAIETAAEEILLKKPFSMTRDRLNNIYLMFTIAVFSPLADNLTYDEEDAIRTLSEKLCEAWRKFFGAIRLHNPSLMNETVDAETAAVAMQDFLEDLFLGEVETELSLEFNQNAYQINTILQIIFDDEEVKR